MIVRMSVMDGNDGGWFGMMCDMWIPKKSLTTYLLLEL